MPVIVTNAKNRIAYNITRSLGQKSVPVYSADFVSPAMTFASRYSKGKFIYPSPYSDQQGFIDCLIEKSIQLKADVLIPVFEETFLIAKYKDLLSKHVNLVLPDYQQILTAHNKDQWNPIAAELGIPVPQSFSAIELQNDIQLMMELRFPVLIKPKQGGGGWAITQVDSAEELKKLLHYSECNDLPWSRFFVQEKIIGDTYCTAMLFRQGEFRAKVTYQQLREYPVKAGQATLRVSIKKPEAEDYFQELLKTLNWHGICQADFIIDRQTKIPYLIDVNPRFWGSLAQGIAAGVNFPFLVYKIAKDGDVAPVSSFQEGVKSRWVGGDLRTFYPSLKRSDAKLKFLKNYFFPGDKNIFFDDLSLNDPFPFMVWSFDALKKILMNRSMAPSVHDSLKGIWK